MPPLEITFVWPQTAIEIAIIVALAVLIRWLARRIITRAVTAATRRPDQRASQLGLSKRSGNQSTASPRQAQRAKTLGTLLRSATEILILVVAVFSILRAFNIDITPALASAGIGGIAIGFGAQSLIKDVISGAFLIFEDQYGVGDYVSIGELSGTVLDVSLRVTQIQDDSGQVWYVRNGEIVTLGNKTQGWSSGVVNIPVALAEDPFKVIGVLNQLCEQINAEQGDQLGLLEPVKVLGLTGFDATSANYGILLKTPGNQQWAAERAVRAGAINLFREHEICAPTAIVKNVVSPGPRLNLAADDTAGDATGN